MTVKVIWHSPMAPHVDRILQVDGSPEDVLERCFTFGNYMPEEGVRRLATTGDGVIALDGPSMSVGDMLTLLSEAGIAVGTWRCDPMGWTCLTRAGVEA